jgi:hypothetical protein
LFLGALVIGGGIATIAAENDRAKRERNERELESVRRFVLNTLAETCLAFSIAPLPIMFVTTGNASSDGHGIRVNLDWFRDLLGRQCTEPVCTRAVARWWIAHEVTHHVHGDALVPLWVRQFHAMELRADYYAGRALAHFGEDISVLERVLRDVAPETTSTHPSFQPRLNAMLAGFNSYSSERDVAHPPHRVSGTLSV